MAESMTQIEQGALARLALIARNNRRFGLAAFGHGLRHCRRIKRQHVSPVFFQPAEKGGITQRAIFDDFRIARANLARRQGFQHIHIGQHQIGLMKSTDEVFAAFAVDCRFAANRAIDLRQQAGGYLDKACATAQNGCGETGQITDNPAAQRDNAIIAFNFLSQ